MSGTSLDAGARIAVVLAALAVLATVAGGAVAAPAVPSADAVSTAPADRTPADTVLANAGTGSADLNGTNLTFRWERNLTATSNASVPLGVVSSMASANGTAFVPGAGLGNNELFAIDGATGTVEWSRALAAFPEGLSAPATGDGMLFVGDYGGTLHALDTDNGTTEWTTGASTSYVGDPLYANGSVYATAYDASTGTTALVAYDADNGTRRWSTGIGTGFSLEAPVAVGDRIVVANASHVVAMAAANGSVAWVTPADGPGTGVAPLASGSGAAIASLDGGAVAGFDVTNGQELWRRDVGASATAPATDGGRVYVGGDALYALDAATGNTEWSESVADVSAAPAVADGVVLVITTPVTGRTLLAVNASTGSRPDTAPLGGRFAVGPTVAGGSAIVADTDGDVDAFGEVDRSATVRLAPANATVEANGTTTLDVAIDNDDPTLGVGNYGFSVASNDTSTVRLVNATLSGDPGFSNVSVAADGSTLNVSAGLLNDTNITVLARITVRGVSNGTAALRLQRAGVNTDELAIPPRIYRVTRRNATVRVGTGPIVTLPPVGDGLAPPRDLDGDGFYEDLDGDEQFIVIDVAVFLEWFDGRMIQRHPERFDFREDGVVNILDVAQLLKRL